MEEERYEITDEERYRLEAEAEAKQKRRSRFVRFVIIPVVLIVGFYVSALLWERDHHRQVRKPVIYLYPEQTMEVSVLLDFNGQLTTTYPAYDNGWKVVAEPDGTLVDANGREYYCLYWEGESDVDFDMLEGFCVKGSETAVFLEKPVAISAQTLETPERTGFTVVEWGGSEIR